MLINEVWRSLPYPRVNLSDPRHEVNVYVTPAGLHWGLLLDAPARGRLGDRNPMHRPFFRSILVPRQRARCLVNLTGVQPGQRQRTAVTLLICFTGCSSRPAMCCERGRTPW